MQPKLSKRKPQQQRSELLTGTAQAARGFSEMTEVSPCPSPFYTPSPHWLRLAPPTPPKQVTSRQRRQLTLGCPDGRLQAPPPAALMTLNTVASPALLRSCWGFQNKRATLQRHSSWKACTLLPLSFQWKVQMLRGLFHFLLLIHRRSDCGVRKPSVYGRHVLQVAAALKVNALWVFREQRSRPTATSAVPESAAERLPAVDGARKHRSHLFLFLSGSCVLPLLWPVFAEADLERLSALRRLLR